MRQPTAKKPGYTIRIPKSVKTAPCAQCTNSKDFTKRISRYIWADYIDENHLRHTEENKQLYALRKKTIERVFTNAKEEHGMRRTTLRGLKNMQAILTFASMNLKELATRLWKLGGSKHKILTFFCLWLQLTTNFQISKRNKEIYLQSDVYMPFLHHMEKQGQVLPFYLINAVNQYPPRIIMVVNTVQISNTMRKGRGPHLTSIK
jgi:hypothetical protein